MTADYTDLQLLHELEPVVETAINRHMRMRKDWNPHDYIPWSDGKNYYALGGQDWDPDQAKLSEVAQTAMVQNLLTEDNLPIYERCIVAYEGNKLEVKEDGIYINGEKTDSYTFNMDYYWMMGDNRDKSADSRYWGFVPEDHVVGKPIVVWLSLDKDRGWFDGKIRWNRIFKWVDGIK